MYSCLRTGQRAPDFSLLATDGKVYCLADFERAETLVVFFSCNHSNCGIGGNEVVRWSAERFAPYGVTFVEINSHRNEIGGENTFGGMVERMARGRYPWIYLYDEHQDAAWAYGATRTPHFFVFDKERGNIYSGRGIDNPLDATNATVNNLDLALIDHLTGKPVATPVTEPVGCEMAWRFPRSPIKALLC